MAGISAMAERLRNTALSLESRHREYTASLASPSPQHGGSRPRHHHSSASSASSAQLLSTAPGSRSPRSNLRPTPAAAVGAAAATTSPRRSLSAASDAAHDVYGDVADDARGVSLAGLCVALNKYDMRLDAAAVEDLFKRADVDRDGFLSRREFQLLAADHTTLVQCFAGRAQRRRREREHEEGIDAAKARLAALREEDERDAKGVEAAREEVLSKYEALKAKQAEAAECDAKLRAAKSGLESAGEDVQTSTNEAQAADSMLKKCHQYSKQATDEFREATETQEYCTKQLKAQEAKESVAVDRLKELEAMLMEQKQEVERQNQRTHRLYHEAKRAVKATEAVKQAVDKWAKEIEEYERHARAAEAKLGDATERARRGAEEHQRCGERLAGLSEEKEALERQVRTLERRQDETEAQRVGGQRRTQLRAKDKETLLGRMVDELARVVAERRRAEEEELPVLQMEVRLRRQRETLEEAEQELRKSRSALDKRAGEQVHPPQAAVAASVVRSSVVRSVASPRRSESRDPLSGALDDHLSGTGEEEDPLADALSSPGRRSSAFVSFAPGEYRPPSYYR